MTIIKTCKVHGVLTKDGIKEWPYKNKTLRRCKKCIDDKNRKYFAQKNSDPIYRALKKQRDKERYELKKTEISAKRKTQEGKEIRNKWCDANRGHVNEYAKNFQRKYRQNLSDPYIKRKIQNDNKNIKIKDIPQSMVDLKRSLMSLNKTIRFQENLLKTKGEKNGY